MIDGSGARAVGRPERGGQGGGRPRVLLIAELANPDWVSVPLEGWSLYEALARVSDVHLVTHVRNEENIRKRGLAAGQFTALDNRSVERPLQAVADFLRGSRDPGGPGQTLVAAAALLSYYRFEQMVWNRFGERLRRGEFDVVHRATPVSVAMPSILARRCALIRVPFVIGPVNGGLPWPPQFTKERMREREWLSYVRVLHKLLPGYVSTRAESAAILVGASFVLASMSPEVREKCVYVPTNAVDPGRFDLLATGAVSLPLRVAFVSRMVPCKMPGLLLDAAIPLLKEGKVRIDFFGDGPELASVKRKAAEAALGGAVSFAGWIEHQEVKKRLAEAHVFAFPSIRDFGGGVVLEAMATGLAPIVIDYGGPADLVSPATGFAVPMGSYQELVSRIRTVLEGLVRNPEEVRPMGLRARARALKQFTWDAKAAQVLEVYRWVQGGRGKPDFGMPLPD